jgi:hypothetical protein
MNYQSVAPYTLDTLESEQDLGDVAVPRLGAVRLLVSLDPPETPWTTKSPTVNLKSTDKTRPSPTLFLEAGKTDQIVEAVPIGT